MQCMHGGFFVCKCLRLIHFRYKYLLIYKQPCIIQAEYIIIGIDSKKKNMQRFIKRLENVRRNSMIEILIVEDEKPISDLIRLNLMKAGYSCTCAFDGMEAADILEERNFDLIILDVMLPKLNGFELMEYIKPLGIPVNISHSKSHFR